MESADRRARIGRRPDGGGGVSAPLRVVIFREGTKWLAQMLEHDIGVQGDHLKDLMLRLAIAIDADRDRLSDLPPPPPYFQHLWPNRAGTFTLATAIDGLDMPLDVAIVA